MTLKIRTGFAVLAVALAVGLSGCGPAGTTSDTTTSGDITSTDQASGSANTPTDAVDAASVSGHVDSGVFLAAAAEEGLTIIDVRTPEEYAAGHLPGALNLNVESASFASEIAELDQDGIYALYCRSGNRSAVAEQAMLGAGFTKVFGLEGGVSALDPSTLVTD